ncbi:MAG: glycosyltransferase family 2 protein [Alphaproteobacteria bacterium]|nr:glycosyltransferase family 2 protein [Alphaproteobacteria bacterium]
MEKKIKPKISVILPCYNVDNYLDDCLNSIINQTIKDIEIICIDDGSTDNTLNILTHYAKLDNRFTVIHQKNQGVALTRNKGINMASGEYLSILDSDDYFDKYMLEKMYQKAKNTNSDIVICRSQELNNQTKNIMSMPYSIQQSLLPAKETFNYSDIPTSIIGFCIGWAWDKLYNREFIKKHNLYFPNLKNSEDFFFVFLSLVLAEKITIMQDIFVTHRMNNPTQLSATRNKYPLCYIEGAYLLHNELKNIKYYSNVQNSFKKWFIDHSIWQLSTLGPNAQKILLQKLQKESFLKLEIPYIQQKYLYQKLSHNSKKTNLITKIKKMLFSTQRKETKRIYTVLGIKFSIKKSKYIARTL